MTFARMFVAVAVGLLAFAGFEALASVAAKASWPAYAAVTAQRAYSIDMLIVRLVAGMAGAGIVGVVASWADGGARRTAIVAGILLLLLSVAHHYTIWNEYPVWYHLAYFAYIVPLAALGSHLVRAKAKSHA